MTGFTVTDEAVEAAARAHWDAGLVRFPARIPWERLVVAFPVEADDARSLARLALEAAARTAQPAPAADANDLWQIIHDWLERLPRDQGLAISEAVNEILALVPQPVDVYYCPTSGETEQNPGGGFDVCCDRPDLHRPVPQLTATREKLTEVLTPILWRSVTPADQRYKDAPEDERRACREFAEDITEELLADGVFKTEAEVRAGERAAVTKAIEALPKFHVATDFRTYLPREDVLNTVRAAAIRAGGQ